MVLVLDILVLRCKDAGVVVKLEMSLAGAIKRCCSGTVGNSPGEALRSPNPTAARVRPPMVSKILSLSLLLSPFKVGVLALPLAEISSSPLSTAPSSLSVSLAVSLSSLSTSSSFSLSVLVQLARKVFSIFIELIEVIEFKELLREADPPPTSVTRSFEVVDDGIMGATTGMVMEGSTASDENDGVRLLLLSTSNEAVNGNSFCVCASNVSLHDSVRFGGFKAVLTADGILVSSDIVLVLDMVDSCDVDEICVCNVDLFRFESRCISPPNDSR
jgi:hypothetical protein